MRASQGDLTVGIIGLGYVGLPTAIDSMMLDSMSGVSTFLRELLTW